VLVTSDHGFDVGLESSRDPRELGHVGGEHGVDPLADAATQNAEVPPGVSKDSAELLFEEVRPVEGLLSSMSLVRSSLSLWRRLSRALRSSHFLTLNVRPTSSLGAPLNKRRRS